VENSGRFLRGPVEALSRAAVERYAAGADQCIKGLDYSDKGEDQYLSLCMHLLKVPAVRLPEMLSDLDFNSMSSPECNSRHAVFHPFKLWDDYMGCMAQSGYILTAPATARDRWTLASGPRSPSIFCWALVQSFGPELSLLQQEQKAGVGIFSCDDHLVISNVSLTDAFGGADAAPRLATINVNMFTPRGGKYMTALNSPVFIKAWHAVFDDGHFRNHEWTMKLDADAVFVSNRVRLLLQRHCSDSECRPKYLLNFGGDVHGPIEVLSRKAMEFYAQGEQRCVKEVDYSDKGEDWYLGLCMELLNIPGEEEPSLLSDWHTDLGEPSACDTLHATFHPFKTWDYYNKCLCQTGYLTPACSRMMMPTTTSTSTTSTVTSTTWTTTSTTATSTTTITTTSTTRTTLPPNTTTVTAAPTTTTTTTTEHRKQILIVGSQGHKGSRATDHDLRGHGTGHGMQPELPGWPALALENSSGPQLAAAIGVLGVVLGVAIGLLVAWGYRKIRARRLEALVPEAVPTSMSEPSEVRLMETGMSLESGTSTDHLLRAEPKETPSKAALSSAARSSRTDGPAE